MKMALVVGNGGAGFGFSVGVSKTTFQQNIALNSNAGKKMSGGK